MPRIEPASIKTAKSVLSWWKGDPDSLTLVSDSGNTIYYFNDHTGTRRVLRMTHASFRTLDEVKAELDFMKHLDREGVKIVPIFPTTNGRGVIATPDSDFWCSAFEFIDGFEMKPDGDHWDENFFKCWGSHMAQLHRASQTFQVAQFAPQLWHWQHDLLIRMADELLPADDRVGRLAYNRVMRECRPLPKTADNYGLIHGDYTPHNFRYHPMLGEIIPFGFRNACYNWFMAGVAGAMISIRSCPNRESVEQQILAGYQSVSELSAEEIASIEIFKRQRALYLYLERLYWPGPNPTDTENAKIKLARSYLESVAGE